MDVDSLVERSRIARAVVRPETVVLALVAAAVLAAAVSLVATIQHLYVAFREPSIGSVQIGASDCR